MWADMSIFDDVHPAFPLPSTALPTLQDALKYGAGEAVIFLSACLSVQAFFLVGLW